MAKLNSKDKMKFRRHSIGTCLYCKDFDLNPTEDRPNVVKTKRRGLPVTKLEIAAITHPSVSWHWQFNITLYFDDVFRNETDILEREMKTQQAVNWDSLDEIMKNAIKEIDKEVNPNFPLLKVEWTATVIG